MKLAMIREGMKGLCQSKNWRNAVGLIDEGYKGMFVVLQILQESDKPITSGELAKKSGVSTARTASALNALEKKGYVIREKEEKDGRKVLIRLTDQGRSVLEERKLKVEETIKPMLSNLTEDEIDDLFCLLKKLLS